MKAARTFFLMLALVGFLFSLIVHLLALLGRAPSSEYWFVMPFLGAFVSWISSALLSGAKAGRMAAIPVSEVVKDCPAWLKRTNYFFDAYVVLIFLGLVLRTSGVFHWKQVELPVGVGFLFLSAVCMTFYAGSFSMLFGKLFGRLSALSNPFLNRPLHSLLRVVFLVASLTSASTTTARS